MKRKKMKTKAMVLEGGGVLGAAEPVLIDVLEDSGKVDLSEFSIFTGTSIGSLNALVYALRFPSKKIVEMWKTINEKDIMPRYRTSFIRKRRKNLIDVFVREKILSANGINPEITCKQVYEEYGSEFYSVSTILQNNKGIIFGHDWHNIAVADAVKYSVSHPIVFDSAPFDFCGKIYDLTDGGIIHNCPIALLIGRKDIEEILCIALNITFEKKERFTGFMDVMKRVLGGTSDRNEILSYYLGYKIWKEKFKFYECKFEKDLDIFDVSEIPYIMEIGKKSAVETTECDYLTWLEPEKAVNNVLFSSKLFV